MAKRKSDPERREFWRLAIELQQQSGLSVREFCKREQLREPSFYMWRSKLRSRYEANGADQRDRQGGLLASRGQGDSRVVKKGAKGVSSHSNTATRETSDSASGVFVPVRVSSDGTVDRRERIEIVLAGSRIVRVPDQFDRQALREVLSVLEEAAC